MSLQAFASRLASMKHFTRDMQHTEQQTCFCALQQRPSRGAEMGPGWLKSAHGRRFDVDAGGSCRTRVGTLTPQAASMRRNIDMQSFQKHRPPTMQARASRSCHGILLDICAPHLITRLARP